MCHDPLRYSMLAIMSCDYDKNIDFLTGCRQLSDIKPSLVVRM